MCTTFSPRILLAHALSRRRASNDEETLDELRRTKSKGAADRESRSIERWDRSKGNGRKSRRWRRTRTRTGTTTATTTTTTTRTWTEDGRWRGGWTSTRELEAGAPGRHAHTFILRCDFKNGGLPLCPLHTGTQTHPTGAAAMDKEYGLRSRWVKLRPTVSSLSGSRTLRSESSHRIYSLTFFSLISNHNFWITDNHIIVTFYGSLYTDVRDNSYDHVDSRSESHMLVTLRICQGYIDTITESSIYVWCRREREREREMRLRRVGWVWGLSGERMRAGTGGRGVKEGKRER